MKPRKEKRKLYRGPKSFDASCRNHGSCPYCRNNRLYQSKKENDRIDFILEEDLLELL